MHAHNTQTILQKGGSGIQTSLELLFINCETWVRYVNSQPHFLKFKIRLTICSLKFIVRIRRCNIWENVLFYKIDKTMIILMLLNNFLEDYTIKNI